MPGKPTIIFVPGAWHAIETWDKVSSLLTTQHYRTVSVPLPTTSGDVSKTLVDDIKAARDAISDEVTHQRDVVVVAHSYGGIVGESAIKGFTGPKQNDAEHSGGVVGLVVIASGFTSPPMSFLEGLGGKPPPIWRFDPSGFAELTVPARELFYHDLPDEEGNYWVSKLTKQSSKAFTVGGEETYTGWKDVPVWFLITTEDKSFPVEAQKMMVEIARDGGADITVREIASSHSPMLSKPKETVDIILEAIAAFV